MLSSNQILLIGCVLLSTFVFGQVPKLKITEGYIIAGYSNAEIRNPSHSDFHMLAPNSLILENNPGALDNTPHYYSPYRSSGGFSLQTGIQFFDKEKNELRKTPTLRLGIRYARVNQFSGWSNIEERTPYDTLTGQNTGSVHYLDSIKSKSVNGNYDYEQISLDASFIFRTNQDLRWSVYGGLGFSFGVSLNAQTNISYSELEYTNIRGYSNHVPNYIIVNGEGVIREHHQNKSSIGGSLYVPLGVDFRLGNTSPFWKMFHLFAEAQPGVSFHSIPELDRTVTQSYIIFNSGIRVRW